MKKLEIGDLVKLKSGGPLMVVSGPARDGEGEGDNRHHCYCEWFDALDQRHCERFSVILLVNYDTFTGKHFPFEPPPEEEVLSCQPASVEQLKLKITDLANSIDVYVHGGYPVDGISIVKELRQLSSD